LHVCAGRTLAQHLAISPLFCYLITAQTNFSRADDCLEAARGARSNKQRKRIAMSKAMDERGKALEDEYFRRKEKEALEKLRAKMTEEEQAKVAAASALRCPKCDGTLEGVIFDGVEIDVCNTCGGAWLDAGELEQLSKRESGGWLSRLLGSEKQG
jgi:uncharacterized protein